MSELHISLVIEALDRFSAPARKVAKAGEMMAARLAEGQKSLRALGTQAKAIARLQGLQGQLGKTAAEMDKARQRTAALGRELAATTQPTKKLQRAFEAARRRSDNLKQQHRQQREALKVLRGELRGAGVDTRHLGAAQRKIADEIAATNRKMRRQAALTAKLTEAQARFDKTLQRAANAALVAGGLRQAGDAMLGALRGPVSHAITFESAMADVRKVVNFAQPDGLTRLGKRLREMSRTIPIAKEGLAAMAAAALLGPGHLPPKRLCQCRHTDAASHART